MKKVGLLPWLLLCVWCSWLFALQGMFASSPSIARWAPDLGLVLLLALDAKLPRGRARAAALLVALARIGFTADPPLAVAAGYLGVAAFFGAVREIVELERPVARTLLAGAATLGLASFWMGCRLLSFSADGRFAPPLELAWPCAASTAAVALLFLPLFGRLPGLSPLWKRVL